MCPLIGVASHRERAVITENAPLREGRRSARPASRRHPYLPSPVLEAAASLCLECFVLSPPRCARRPATSQPGQSTYIPGVCQTRGSVQVQPCSQDGDGLVTRC